MFLVPGILDVCIGAIAFCIFSPKVWIIFGIVIIWIWLSNIIVRENQRNIKEKTTEAKEKTYKDQFDFLRSYSDALPHKINYLKTGEMNLNSLRITKCNTLFKPEYNFIELNKSYTIGNGEAMLGDSLIRIMRDYDHYKFFKSKLIYSGGFSGTPGFNTIILCKEDSKNAIYRELLFYINHKEYDVISYINLQLSVRIRNHIDKANNDVSFEFNTRNFIDKNRYASDLLDNYFGWDVENDFMIFDAQHYNDNDLQILIQLLKNEHDDYISMGEDLFIKSRNMRGV